jgi:formamidopyrimidine-DNA glycosylase
MPELPEVETVRRGLAPLLVGRRLLRAQVAERRLREPVRLAEFRRVEGATVTDVRRRSKYLLLDTSSGQTVLVHLGMTGHIWVADPDRAPAPHQHVVIPLDDGRELRFADTRRFGLLRVVAEARLPQHPLLRGLGPEPFDPALSAADLMRGSRGRRRPIKSLLLDTRAIAGIGNIYACESLFRAGIHPASAVGRIRTARWERLLEELRAVLNEAIQAGGTTLRDFLNAEGGPGYFRIRLRVYDREGDPCGRCGRGIRRIVQAGRSTFYCTGCQR